MKAVVAIDSFKGSFTSGEAATIVAQTWEPFGIECTAVTLADGGEGTSTAFMKNQPDGEWITTKVHDPCNQMILAKYAYFPMRRLAVIDSAEASGLQSVITKTGFVAPDTTSSVGTGELITAAIEHGAKEIVVGLGGTGTTDAGIGLMGVLGAKFYDAECKLLPAQVTSLSQIDHLDLTQVVTKEVRIIACTDVDSPLTGPDGAVKMFGPQKGVLQEQDQFEQWFQHFARIADPEQVGQVPGDGAAGGLGFALRLLAATRVSGFQLMSRVTKLAAKIADADLVVTGEGQLDEQSLHGKLPVQVAQLANQYHKPCLCVAGSIKIPMATIQQAGFITAVPLIHNITDLATAMRQGKQNLQIVMERIAPLLNN